MVLWSPDWGGNLDIGEGEEEFPMGSPCIILYLDLRLLVRLGQLQELKLRVYAAFSADSTRDAARVKAKETH